MSTIFCCSSISPFRPQKLDHEAKFNGFVKWAGDQTASLVLQDSYSLVSNAPYAIQLVRQINYGPQESIRYFIPASKSFTEATEDDLMKSNFEKMNSYKNYRCNSHNRFFEINLYQKNPENVHHWRATLARPSRDIDLIYRAKKNDTGEKPLSEEDREPMSSDIQAKVSSANLPSSLPNITQEGHEVALPKSHPICGPNDATLKSVLQFLLPIVGKNLPSSSSLISLLSLDWANTVLNLGIELEDLWTAELTSSNITKFFDSFIEDSHSRLKVNVAEIEDLVLSAMCDVDIRGEENVPGISKLHQIVKEVLSSGRESYWIHMCGDRMASLFTTGLTKESLEQCQRKDSQLQQNSSDPAFERSPIRQTEKDREAYISMSIQAQDDKIEDYYTHDQSDYEPIKDFTACDKECGYCGNCDY